MTSIKKYRAAIIGAGRMGVGWGVDLPYVYDHASAYLALKDRVELVAVCDTDEARALEVCGRLDVPGSTSIYHIWRDYKPDIVSICTPNGTHQEVMEQLYEAPSVKAVWMEKPFECGDYALDRIKIQVNYCRRFCSKHRLAKEFCKGEQAYLDVWARKDWTTIVHFADLARFWEIPKERIRYHDNTGEFPSTNSYRLDCGKWSMDFRNGGCKGGFMETALTELLDLLDGKRTELSSPASSAIESEKLAKELMDA